MCKRNKGLWLVAAILLLAGVVLGQTRSRARSKPLTPAPVATVKPVAAKRFVTVQLKQGEPVRGALLRADAESVQLEVRNSPVTIATENILSLHFASAPTASPTPAEAAKPTPTATPDQSLRTASQIQQVLRKLNDAAKIGLPYPQYASLLVETKAFVEERLAQLPENALKGESALALEAYLDAGQAWSAGLATGLLPLASEPGATLYKKYDLKPGVNQLGEQDHLRLDTTLGSIWQRGAKHLDNLGMLLQQR